MYGIGSLRMVALTATLTPSGDGSVMATPHTGTAREGQGQRPNLGRLDGLDLMGEGEMRLLPEAFAGTSGCTRPRQEDSLLVGGREKPPTHPL